MPNLLREGSRVPDFALKNTEGEEVRYASFLRKRRLVLLSLSDKPATPADNGRAWLAAAREAAKQFAERDLTVLVLARDPAAVAEVRNLPPGTFSVLSDPRGEVAARLGGSPAFYLIGKDTGIKQAARTCPPLKSLFGLIDAMPMRRQEMGGG